MPASGVVEWLRPYLWLMAAAALAGFLSYVVFAGAHAPATAEPQFSPRVSAPAAEDWSQPKHI